MTLTFKQIQERAYTTAQSKGWHDTPLRSADGEYDYNAILAKHALMHTELTEAHDCLNEGTLQIYTDGGKPEGFSVEIADFIIRICDTTQAMGLSLRRIGSVREFDCEEDWIERTATYRPASEIRRCVDFQRVESATMWLSYIRRWVDEATEAARREDWNVYADRLTLAIVSSASIVTGLDLDLAEALRVKMDYNETRPHRHGGKKA